MALLIATYPSCRYTRLTRSGLSMTEWKLGGTKLPSTLDEWTVAFDKYKLTPEYLKLNKVTHTNLALRLSRGSHFWAL